MRVFLEDHNGKELTGVRMYQLAKDFWPDLGNHLHQDFQSFYAGVRAIPYQNDGEKFRSPVVELLGRPAYLMDRDLLPRLDCKKKSILLGAFCEGNGIPWKLVAISEKPDKQIHHVLPMVKLGNTWATADATLPAYFIGQGKSFTKAEELLR